LKNLMLQASNRSGLYLYKPEDLVALKDKLVLILLIFSTSRSR